MLNYENKQIMLLKKIGLFCAMISMKFGLIRITVKLHLKYDKYHAKTVSMIN